MVVWGSGVWQGGVGCALPFGVVRQAHHERPLESAAPLLGSLNSQTKCNTWLSRTLPRKTDLATLSDDRFTQLIQAYNNTPRKCLDYRTPAEIFLDRVLHLKCESTFPSARERRRGNPLVVSLSNHAGGMRPSTMLRANGYQSTPGGKTYTSWVCGQRFWILHFVQNDPTPLMGSRLLGNDGWGRFANRLYKSAIARWGDAPFDKLRANGYQSPPLDAVIAGTTKGGPCHLPTPAALSGISCGQRRGCTALPLHPRRRRISPGRNRAAVGYRTPLARRR